MHEIDLVIINDYNRIFDALGLQLQLREDEYSSNNFYIKTNGEYSSIPQKASRGLISSIDAEKPYYEKVCIRSIGMDDVEKNFRTKFYVKNRCLIPVDGFIEYQYENENGKTLQKQLITNSNNEPFVIGGIWNRVGVLLTFCVITVPATGIMKEISNRGRNRMPLILHPDEYDSWLAGKPLQKFLNTAIGLKSEKVDWRYPIRN